MSQTNINLVPGTLTLITLSLLFLKAFDKINISWFWVFSPLIIGGLLLFAGLIIALILAILTD